MSNLNIVAVLTIKPEYQADFQPEFKKLVEASRQEKGCVRYDLHQDVNDSNVYIFTETWESQEAIDIHNKTKHFTGFGAFAEGKALGLVIHVVKQVI